MFTLTYIHLFIHLLFTDCFINTLHMILARHSYLMSGDHPKQLLSCI